MKIVSLVTLRWTYFVPPGMFLIGVYVFFDFNEWPNYTLIVWACTILLIPIGLVHTVMHRWMIDIDSNDKSIYAKFIGRQRIEAISILTYKNNYVIQTKTDVFVISSDDHKISNEFYSEVVSKHQNHKLTYLQYLAIRYSFGLYKITLQDGEL